MKTYAAVYLGSAILALAGTPLVVRLARRWGLMDQPGVRKVHSRAVPRVGGIVLFGATMLLVLPVLLLNNTIGAEFRAIQGQIVMLLVSAAFIFLVGLVDDIRSCGAKVKLLCLLGASLAICVTGARIHSITLAQGWSWSLGWSSWPLTVLWITGVTVAMNFMDGLDGLAAGIAAIACAAIAVMSFYGGQRVMGVLMLAVVGALTGFLFFNFNPAKIFMGDCGSMFLGFLIGAGSVVASAKKSALLGIAVPALALAVPIVDAVFTFIRRGVLDRRSVFAAERGHIHHRLLDRGLQHRNAVLVIYGVTFLSAGLGTCMLICRSAASLVLFLAAVAFVLLVFHALGVARLDETFRAVRRNSNISHKAKADRGSFEDAQLRIREARSFESWWNALTTLAGELEFDRLAMVYHQGGRHGHTHVWRRTEERLLPGEVIHLDIPVPLVDRLSLCWFELDVRRNGSMETIGRRMMFFGRLLDECATLCARQQALRSKEVSLAADGGYRIQPPKHAPSAVPGASPTVPAAVAGTELGGI